MEAVVVPIVEPVVESVVGRIKKQAGYIISGKKYVEDMRTEKQKLKNLYDGVEDRGKHNTVNSLVVPPEVTTWLKNAKDIIAQVDGSDIKAGSCYNFMNRRAVGSEADKMTIDIKKLIDEGKNLTWFDYRIPGGIVNSTAASASAPPSSDYIEFPSRNLTSQELDMINVNVMFPSYLTPISNHLVNIRLHACEEVDVVFEVKSPSSQNSVKAQITEQPLLPIYLKRLELKRMERMSRVWKCNWTEFLILQKQPQECSFRDLTTIALSECRNMKYLFSPLMAELLPNLSEVKIDSCDGMEEVVSSRDDGKMTTSMHTRNPLFPRLNWLTLDFMKRLERIDGGATRDASNEISDKNTQVGAVSWSLCQYARQIRINSCDALPYVVPFYASTKMHQLQVLQIYSCESMMEVFESQGINNSGDGSTTYADERRDCGTSVALATPRVKDIEVPQLSNLKEVDIYKCNILQYVFTFSTLESLSQLAALKIGECEAMKVIVQDEDASKAVFFPRLRSIELDRLPSLEGFFLGKNDFQWPILDDVTIMNCPKMTIFTSGQSTAKKLKFVRTSLGIHSLEGDLKVKTKFPDTESTRSHPTALESAWSFHNLSQMIVESDHSMRRIVPSNELLQLQKLVKILVRKCNQLEEVFEVVASEEINDRIGFSEAQKAVVELPNLTEVNLEYLPSLKYIWKSNQWTVVKFPYLTRLSVVGCKNLEYVFTSSMVGSVPQLQELRVRHADTKVIVKEEEECEGKANEHELWNLKSLKLESLPYLKGFCLGKDAFSWPSLESLSILKCPKIDVFTNGHSDTPKLKAITTSFGECNVDNDLNSFIKTNQQLFDLEDVKKLSE